MIDKDKVVYLAVPYAPTEKQVAAKMPVLTHLETLERVMMLIDFVKADIMQRRAKKADQAAAWLMQQGYTVLSPISHSHGIAQHMAPEKRVDHELWMRQDRPLVQASDVMVILTLDGWRESKGIRHEVREFAKKRFWWNQHERFKTGRNVFFLNRVPGGYELSRRPR